AGVPLYAQVDSVNINTTYGAILENHEILGTAYNNIASVNGSSLAAQGVVDTTPVVVFPKTSGNRLPPRTQATVTPMPTLVLTPTVTLTPTLVLTPTLTP